MASKLTVRRGGIYLADLNPTRGSEINKTRPVLVVSRDEMNKHLETVVVCPLTTSLHPHWASRVQVQCAGKAAEVAVDQIRTISKARLIRKLDKLSRQRQLMVAEMVRELYG
ncbi:MAG: type II toxin-antitoxin system PemK/MazF family toxin [Verrucomicrobiota bacterium]